MQYLKCNQFYCQDNFQVHHPYSSPAVGRHIAKLQNKNKNRFTHDLSYEDISYYYIVGNVNSINDYEE